MTRTGMLHIRYPADELGRFQTLLKHAEIGQQFVTQAIEVLREIIGTGVLYDDEGAGRRRAKAIVSVKGAIALRKAAPRKAAPASPSRKPHRKRKVR